MLEKLNEEVGICLLAVDECHLVSQWGNDFRPSYRKIGELLRDKLPNIPFMALTATATPNVRIDIIKSLKLKNPLVTITSFDRFVIKFDLVFVLLLLFFRNNLYMSASLKSTNILKDLRSLMSDEKKTKYDGPTIIYCQTKKLTGEIVNLLRTIGVKCDRYHADVEISMRKSIQKMFLTDAIDVSIYKFFSLLNYFFLLSLNSGNCCDCW